MAKKENLLHRRDCDKSHRRLQRRWEETIGAEPRRDATCVCLSAPTGAPPAKKRVRFFSANVVGGELRAIMA